jgi:3-oxoacyl-[acyl-carrier-protein] synthase III
VKTAARSYDGVALCCPVTVPYVRRSDHGAAWFLAQALRRLLDASGVAKSDIDGLCASSFTLPPSPSRSMSDCRRASWNGCRWAAPAA